MPVTATPQTAPGYVALTPGAGYLKNVGPLGTDGLTQDDLDTAAAAASARIDAALSGHFDIAAWPEATPPIVARIAELLASADVLDFKHARHDPATKDPFAESLRAEAEFLLRQLRTGRLRVVGPDGAVQQRTAAAPNIGRA